MSALRPYPGFQFINEKTCEGGANLAKPNYQFEKRQKDLAKKKKNEEKRQRKLEKKNAQSGESQEQSPDVANKTSE